VIDALVALGFGASLISIFARLGGGIFTKGADVGGDLVGKVEAGIPGRRSAQPCDHRRQRRRQCRRLRRHGGRPVRNLCGDRCRHDGSWQPSSSRGMEVLGSDDALSAGDLRSLPRSSPRSSARSSSSSEPERLDHGRALQGPDRNRRPVDHRPRRRHVVDHRLGRNRDRYRRSSRSPVGTCSSAVSSASSSPALIVVITEYYTGTNKRPVNSISQASVTGHGTNVIQGLAVSLESTALPAIVIVGGIIVDLPACRPVRHRHRGDGHARHCRHDRGARRFRPGHRQCRRHRRNVGSSIRKSVKATDALDAVGNTTKAVTKGYAIGSAGLGALVLFAAYSNDLGSSLPARRTAEGSTLYPYFARIWARSRSRSVQPVCGCRPDLRRPDPVPVRRHRHDCRRPCSWFDR
jgi:K(+)-stimulated pyrophosphate-energized sodium pump